MQKINQEIKLKMNNTIKKISEALDPYDWFYSAEMENKSIVVYVNLMTAEILSKIPDSVDGYQVKAAFVSYLLCEDRYGSKASFIKDAILDYFV